MSHAEALAPLVGLGARLAACRLLPTSDGFDAAHSRQAQHARAPFTKGEKPAFHTPLDNFVKLRLWQLPYERVVFLDADTIVVRNIDRLFEYPEFSAAPNVYESVGDFRRLNSGVFAARPIAETFAAMLARLDRPGAFWKRTDQTFLEAFFPDWQGLPVYDNLLQYVWLNLPELWDWGLVRVIHYQYEKPWDPANAKAESLRPLVDLWRAFHDGDGDPRPRRPAPSRLMHVLVTGASGVVGRFVVPALAAAGHRVTTLGRRPGRPAVGPRRDARRRCRAADALVHLALAHRPGAYRGGEGDDPEGFRRLNLDGTRALFDAAGDARIVFLSSRAVYGDRRRGVFLKESDAAEPDSLYGEVKLLGEEAVGGAGRSAAGDRGLWRAAAQVGGAVRRLSRRAAGRAAGGDGGPRRRRGGGGGGAARQGGDRGVQRVGPDARPPRPARAGAGAHRLPCPPPPRFAGEPPGRMATCRLRMLGWRPGGWAKLDGFLAGVRFS